MYISMEICIHAECVLSIPVEKVGVQLVIIISHY